MKWLRFVMINRVTSANLLKKFLERMRLREDDTLYAIKTTMGVKDPDFAQQLEVAEDVMHEWRNVLRKLGE